MLAEGATGSCKRSCTAWLKAQGCSEKEVHGNSGIPRVSVGIRVSPERLRGSGQGLGWNMRFRTAGGVLYEFHSGYQPTTALHTQ
jgi:hypothetical protein